MPRSRLTVVRASRFVCRHGTLVVAACLLAAAGCRSRDASACDGAPEPTPTCGPSPVDPRLAVFDTLDQFRSVAAALVCERAIECDGQGPFWSFGQAYCHPGFARFEAERTGHLLRPFDLRLARTAFDALANAPSCDLAFEAAEVCRAISEGPLGDRCLGPTDCDALTVSFECRDGVCVLPVAGEPCVTTCEPPFRCVADTCVMPAGPGAGCGSSDECRSDLVCADGLCDHTPLGAPCNAETCGPGLVCWGTCEIAPAYGSCCHYTRTDGWLGSYVLSNCGVGTCVAHRCVPRPTIGCSCDIDDNCPWDVSECVAGVCTARPMAGEPCSPTGATCFGSVCTDGVCV